MLHLQQSQPHAGFRQEDPAFDWSSALKFVPSPSTSVIRGLRTPLHGKQHNITSRPQESVKRRKLSNWTGLEKKPLSTSEIEEEGEVFGQDMSNGHGLQHGSSELLVGSLPNPGGRNHNAMAYVYNSRQQQALNGVSRPASRAPSPIQFEKPPGQDYATSTRYSGHPAVASYLHLPPEIAAGRPGSLAAFAAQITCLFWFESKAVLASVENSDKFQTSVLRLVPEAKPATGFLKWVTTILTTTQVATNVVLLALMFIYRLKKQNPYVQGKPGSEFRLLTVALMLGNKFLDDNTYTNKTWADVSGIPVYEIHIMEVEFLSHMKYNLYTSKEQWLEWYSQLNKFWTYCELASCKVDDSSEYFPLERSSVQTSFTLPSPPASQSASPPYVPTLSPNSADQAGHSNLSGYLAPLSISPVGSMSEYDLAGASRKRSWDDVYHEPPPKRLHVTSPQRTANSQSAYTPQSGNLPSLPSLPFPTLPMPTSQGTWTSHAAYAPQMSAPFQTYTPDSITTTTPQIPSGNWLQAVPSSVSAQKRAHPGSAHCLSYENMSLPTPVSAIGYSSIYASKTTTPAAGHARYVEAHPDQQRLSPSHYLSKRTSPYRPVRNISQLVQAPPSSHMSRYPAQVSHNQIQWQPLKKGNASDNEVRNGRVPQFAAQGYNSNWWPTAYHSDSAYPPYDSLPQIH